jgi:four helix bundle protein
LVEGSSRSSVADYCRFVELALGSAQECGYLLQLAEEVLAMQRGSLANLAERYDEVCAVLAAIIKTLRQTK